MSTELGEPSRHVLPYDVAIAPRASVGNVLKRGKDPSPPTFEELRTGGVIASQEAPDRWFSSREKLTADWLRHRGLAVTSVRARDGRHFKTPDAVAIPEAVTIEIKGAVATTNAIVQQVRVGRKQSRRVVVDLRGSGATRTLAEAALQSALSMYGDHLEEVVLIVSGDLALGWAHG